MDCLYMLALGVIVFHLLACCLIILGDCDLILMYKVYFGKPVESLKGKVIWITGASSGIGEYLAYELAKGGARLVLSARREDQLERVKKECQLRSKVTNDADIMVLKLDVTDYKSHAGAVKKVLDHFKEVDVLVNNAGRSQRAEWIKTSLDVDREMLELNVLGVLSLTKEVIPHMIDRRDGHIVNMSSVTGKLGAPISGSYTGTKHALQGWFDTLRIEVCNKNITVTSLCPGPVFSNLLETAFTEEAGKDFKGKMNPKDKRMKTDRSAYLSAVAIANKVDEAWITINPVLIFVYLNQYFPNLSKWIGKKIGIATINKIREGQH